MSCTNYPKNWQQITKEQAEHVGGTTDDTYSLVIFSFLLEARKFSRVTREWHSFINMKMHRMHVMFIFHFHDKERLTLWCLMDTHGPKIKYNHVIFGLYRVYNMKKLRHCYNLNTKNCQLLPYLMPV